jgi:hypothetical protein
MALLERRPRREGIEGIRGGDAAPTGAGGIKVDASLFFQRGVDKVGDIDPRALFWILPVDPAAIQVVVGIDVHQQTLGHAGIAPDPVGAVMVLDAMNRPRVYACACIGCRGE